MDKAPRKKPGVGHQGFQAICNYSMLSPKEREEHEHHLHIQGCLSWCKPILDEIESRAKEDKAQ